MGAGGDMLPSLIPGLAQFISLNVIYADEHKLN